MAVAFTPRTFVIQHLIGSESASRPRFLLRTPSGAKPGSVAVSPGGTDRREALGATIHGGRARCHKPRVPPGATTTKDAPGTTIHRFRSVRQSTGSARCDNPRVPPATTNNRRAGLKGAARSRAVQSPLRATISAPMRCVAVRRGNIPQSDRDRAGAFNLVFVVASVGLAASARARISHPFFATVADTYRDRHIFTKKTILIS
jgi:hypothetical protein